MKKIVFALFLLFSFCNSYSQITYTPQTAAGYQFKYVKSDSGFALPFIDTSLRRGVNRIGAVVARPQDSLLYYWTGAKWSKINADVSGLISLINSKVDSVTVYGNDLKYWINGVAVQYSLNTYLGNLQTVTNNGNTTTNDIQVNRLQANAAITATQINASDYLFRTLTNNAFADSLRGYIKGDSLTHNNLNWYLPDTTGTFVLRINGVAPDKNGNVTGLFGGGSGSLDTTTIYNNIALKLNIADSANYATQYEINTTNNQVTANTAAITQRVTYANLIDSLNNLSLSKTGDTITLNVNGRQFKVKDSVGTGGGGSITLAAIGSTPNADGATISGSTLNLQPADSTYGGLVSTSQQKFRGEKTFTDNVSINNNILYMNSTAGTQGTFIQMKRNYLGNIVGNGQIGLLGGGVSHAELNLSLGMDYTDGTHKYFDSTKPALWQYMYSLPSGAGTSWGLQWVKEGHTNNNIYSLYGKDPFRIDVLPHTGTGEAVQGGSRVLTQQLRLIDGNYNPSIYADLKLTGEFFELTGATEVGLKALRISKGGSPNIVSDAIATYKTTGGMNKFHFLNDDNADNYHWNIFEKYQGGTNRDLGGAGKFYLRNWASGGMMDWGLRSQANLFNGSSSKLDYYFATLDGDFVTRDKMVLSYDGSLTINNLASGYVKSTSGLLSSSTSIPQADITNLTTDLAAKQATLVSGTNIKTVNGNSLLGSGDVVISGGSGLTYSQTKAIANK